MSALADLLETKLGTSLAPWAEATRALIAALRDAKGGAARVFAQISAADQEPFRREIFALIEAARAEVSAQEANALTAFFVELATSTSSAPQLSLSAITDALPVLVSYVTADERYGMVNRAYEDWFGIPREHLIGKTLLEVIGPAAYAALSPHVRRALAGERFSFEQHGVPYRLAGKRDVRVDFVPHLRDDGSPNGYVALLQDITRERTQELEREALLAGEQAARAEAQAERRMAESANRSKDQFLAMLGHELRNPLAPISTALELMKLQGTPTFVREREIIERQVDHLTRLVDDLLDVSRIMSGKAELARRRVPIVTVVSSAIEIASPLLERRGHHLEVSVESDDLEVGGDAVRLAQVVSNLLTNAAKYTEPGGRIELTAFREGDDVVLRVRDNGIGIGPEMLGSVFDLFAQEQQSLERAKGGLGLGLTIVKSLVELHGGTVTAESPGQGQGSTFTIRLPVGVSSTPAPPSIAARDRVAARARSLNVLVVDDNVDAAELLAMALGRMGHEIRVAHDGPSALQLVESFIPDVAVLDIGLPVMDGYELAERLRSIPALREARLIAVTGYGQATDREKSAAAGFDAHLVKPVRLAELESCFADVLAR
jgi:PAS domain S-box-containing protein